MELVMWHDYNKFDKSLHFVLCVDNVKMLIHFVLELVRMHIEKCDLFWFNYNLISGMKNIFVFKPSKDLMDSDSERKTQNFEFHILK